MLRASAHFLLMAANTATNGARTVQAGFAPKPVPRQHNISARYSRRDGRLSRQLASEGSNDQDY